MNKLNEEKRKIQSAREIGVVVPVKNNQEGVDRLLMTLFEKTPPQHYPRCVVIVDNNSDEPLAIKDDFLKKEVDVFLIKCSIIGPAAARNAGVKFIKDNGIDVPWIHFIDSDCLFTERTLEGFIIDSSTEAIAYQGKILSLGSDWLSKFYELHGILSPQVIEDEDNIRHPTYLVSASLLVNLNEFEKVGGFDESLKVGEDVDLSYRLTNKGKLVFADHSEALHDFLEFDTELKNKHITLLINRIRRYSTGERILDKKYCHLLKKYQKEMQTTSAEGIPPMEYSLLTILLDETYRNASFMSQFKG